MSPRTDSPAPELEAPEAVYQAEPGERSYSGVLVIATAVGFAALALLHIAGRLGLLQ